jgi:hypothetical protein
MGGKEKACKVVEGKRPLGRLTHGWEGNIEIDLIETGSEPVIGSCEWKMFGSSSIPEQLVVSQEELNFSELVS